MFRCTLFTVLLVPLVSAEVFRLGDYTAGQQSIEQIKLNIEHAFTKAGHAVQWVELPPERSLREANAGLLDGEILRLKSAVGDSPNLLPIDFPAYRVEYWAHVHEDSDCPAQMSEINHFKPIGTPGLRFFQYAYDLSDVGYETTKGIESIYQMLAAGRADYTILPLVNAADYSARFNVNIVPCFDKPLVTENLYTFLHVKHSHLIAALQASFKEVFVED